jgi:hypothetical protein
MRLASIRLVMGWALLTDPLVLLLLLLAAGGLVVTAGADKTLQVLEPRAGYSRMHSLQLPDFPYSLGVLGELALCGCGDGSCLVVDTGGGRVLYGLGANKGAVRAIEACGDALLCAGDDGAAVLYSFSQ